MTMTTTTPPCSRWPSPPSPSPVPAPPRPRTSWPPWGRRRIPKVPVSWDRYYDHAAIGEIGRRLQKAYPDRCRFGSIGTSHEGRELWLITVTNFDTGNPDDKPAMYIDGNIHSNEIQGAEFSLYTAWYLCEMADRVPWVDSLLDRARLLHRADDQSRRARRLHPQRPTPPARRAPALVAARQRRRRRRGRGRLRRPRRRRPHHPDAPPQPERPLQVSPRRRPAHHDPRRRRPAG